MDESIKKIFPVLMVVLLLWGLDSVLAQQQPCKWLIPAETTMIDGRSGFSQVKPGDTICLSSGNKLFLWISYLHGTKASPIVICNKDGLVSISGFYYGLKFDSCSYIKLTGFSVANPKYGIKIHDVSGAGISIEGLSTDIEVEGIEVSKTMLVGLFAKTDPDCQFTSTRGKYTLRNLSIHDNYFRQTGMEAFYIGSSFYEGQTIPCGGVDTTVLPHLLRGVKVYNNIIENTGWDGIQVSCSDSGCAIHDNFIRYDSDSAYTYQMSGIMMGGGSTCDCFNNIIKDGKGDGIDVFSLGNQKIYNNLIINAGRTYHYNENYYPYLKHGIYIGNGVTTPNAGFSLFYNTIVSPKSTGIRFANLISKNNLISNNIIVNPGLYQSEGDNAFISITDPSIIVSISNNYFNKYIGSAEFVDSTGNFDLKPISPAINKGTAVAGFPLLFDIINRNRPFSSANDIGAYECHDSSLLTIHEMLDSTLCSVILTPNPFYNSLKIILTTREKMAVNIQMVGANGQDALKPINLSLESGRVEYLIDTSTLGPGFYTCKILTPKKLIIRKLIHVKVI